MGKCTNAVSAGNGIVKMINLNIKQCAKLLRVRVINAFLVINEDSGHACVAK